MAGELTARLFQTSYHPQKVRHLPLRRLQAEGDRLANACDYRQRADRGNRCRHAQYRPVGAIQLAFGYSIRGRNVARTVIHLDAWCRLAFGEAGFQ